jgi:DnaJ-class molecular chaperone
MTDKPCKHCKGKGTYVVKETYGDGDTALIPYECNHCHGSGREQDPDAGDPFDFSGGSLDDDD